MKFNVWTIGFFTGLILSLSSINKAVTFDTQSQDIAKSAKLTPSQVEKLISLSKNNKIGKKFQAIVPTYIPVGFQINELEAINNESELSYRIVYRNILNNSCFHLIKAIHLKPRQPPDYSVNAWETVEVDLPILGKVNLDYYKSDIISTQPCIKLRSSENIEFESPVGNCNVISMQEAVKIVESLQYLNP